MSKERFRGHPGYDTLTDEEREEMRERAKRQRGDAESGAVKESDAGTYDTTKLLAQLAAVTKERDEGIEMSLISGLEEWVDEPVLGRSEEFDVGYRAAQSFVRDTLCACRYCVKKENVNEQ
jgi:hypothetical protein